ncbi:basic blue protein-like [Lycium ferocissimum]|uniref:basic blue protein-like n=1 Tax=Lycium ferocissimum TaxID=112874 RepID=UPI0028151474|nr:basic blue protein-like [Lycium ferocissimum]
MPGGNKVTIFALAMMLCILLQTSISNADTFPAGGTNGWGFSMNDWPNDKIFKVGDVIEFKYPTGIHNVVQVSKAGFDSCDGTGGQVFSSGDDKITLAQGTTYFICSIGQHCANGVKAAVTTK